MLTHSMLLKIHDEAQTRRDDGKKRQDTNVPPSSQLLANHPVPQFEPVAHWPFPGLSANDTARASIASSSAYVDLIAAVIKFHGGPVTESQVIALIPAEWRVLLGRWAHGHLTTTQARERGIEANYVGHDASGDRVGGFHFSYRVTAG